MKLRAGLTGAAAAILTLSACGGGGDSGTGTGVLTPGSGSGNAPTLNVEQVFNSLNFTSPVALLQAPADNSRWFVVEQAGRVMVFANTSTVTTADPFLDIRTRVTTGGEMGLLGMAFHPSYPTDRRLFVYYTNDSAAGRVSRISVFTINSNGLTADPNSEQILLAVNQPLNEDNHKGGGMAFGPDGKLYVGFGDGGGSNDQHGTEMGNAQDLKTLLGKMIRIDVGAANSTTYTVPTDNLNASNPRCSATGRNTVPCPEIYAFGLRNPWRWSFDRSTGDLWVADVGQNALEEIDRITLGGNYGWRCFEGTNTTANSCSALQNPVAPIAQYGRSLGTAITGGYVYRGSNYSSLVGRYVFGDYISGRIWSIPANTSATLTVTGGFQSNLSISAFGQAQDGEIYLLNYATGRIYHLTAS